MPEGWVKLHRKIRESKVWYYTESQLKVWITILTLVNYKTGWSRHDGEEIELDPGQMTTSMEYISKEAGVSHNIVRKTLNKLEDDGMITTDRTNKGTLLTVLNWGDYQNNGEGVYKQGGERGGEQTGERGGDTRRSKEEKEGKETNADSDSDDNFLDQIKEVYDYWMDQDRLTSHRKLTSSFKSTIRARLRDGWTVDEMTEVIDNYCKLLDVSDRDEYKVMGIHQNWSVGELFKRGEGEKANKIYQSPKSFIEKINTNGSQSREEKVSQQWQQAVKN